MTQERLAVLCEIDSVRAQRLKKRRNINLLNLCIPFPTSKKVYGKILLLWYKLIILKKDVSVAIWTIDIEMHH